MSVFRPRIRRDTVRAVAVVAALLAAPVALVALPAVESGAQAQEPGSPVMVTATPTVDLNDGDVVDVVINPTRPGVTVTDSYMYLCRDGETFTYRGEPATTIADLQAGTGKCAASDIPFSSTQGLYDVVVYGFPDGTARGTLRVGTGTSNGVTCDDVTPCRLVIAYTYIENGSNSIGIDASTLLSFLDPSQSAPGCAGVDSGAARSVGSERLSTAWRQWTRTRCQAQGAAAMASTSAALTDERSGLEAFAAGDADLVYSAVGYGGSEAAPTNPETTMANPAVKRPYVATPVAVNAVVVAVAGGHTTLTPDSWPTRIPQPFTDVELTIGEVATLFGSNYFRVDWDAVDARNPQVAAIPPVIGNSRPEGPLAPGGPDARALFASTFFDALAPEQWVDDARQTGAPRGVTVDFAHANPPFTSLNHLQYTNGPALAKPVYGIAAQPPNDRAGALWALTDYATAIELGMTPVAIEFEPGAGFVKPTPESIAAGADALVRQPDGTYAPDPTQLAPGAYPLAMVEHALAPADPLPADKCATGGLTAEWLGYVTGADGQAVAAEAGFVPLTASLQAEAAGAVERLGALAGPACGAPAPTVPPTAPPASLGGGGFGGSTGPGGSGAARRPATSTNGGGSGLMNVPMAPDAETEATAVALAEEAEVEMPPFLGVRGFDEVGPPVALLTIVGIMTGASLAASGRPLPASLTGAPRRLGRWLRLRVGGAAGAG